MLSNLDLKTKYLNLDFLNLSVRKLIISSEYLKGIFNYEIINSAYICELFPTKEQELLFKKTFGCRRFVWNKMLSDKIFFYKQIGESLYVTPADYKEEFAFLKEVDSLALANAQLALDKAYKQFFKTKKGFPKFKKKGVDESYTTNNQKSKTGSHSIEIKNNKIKLPKFKEGIKFTSHRPIEGLIKNATIKYSNNKYTISICVEQLLKKSRPIAPITTEFIGLDFSCIEFYVDSNNNTANFESFYHKAQKKLAKLQRKLSKKVKGSSNYNKLKAKISKLHTHVANQRKDFLHKLSTKLVKKYKFVCVEDINLRDMSQCLKLGKSIMSKGFGMFRTFLSYKLERTGGKLIFVGKWFASSKTCSCCGYINKELTLKDRTWICPDCSTIHKRDYNAAINIKNEGYRIITCSNNSIAYKYKNSLWKPRSIMLSLR